jgi:hypothetical protein
LNGVGRKRKPKFHEESKNRNRSHFAAVVGLRIMPAVNRFWESLTRNCHSALNFGKDIEIAGGGRSVVEAWRIWFKEAFSLFLKRFEDEH